MPRVLFFLIFAFVLVSTPVRAEFDVPGLAADAASYEDSLRAGGPPQPKQAAIDAALSAARAAEKSGDADKAIAALQTAVKQGDRRAETWFAVSDAWLKLSASKRDPSRALQAAWLAYVAAAADGPRGDPAAMSRALSQLATILDRNLAMPVLALAALEEMERRQPTFDGLAARLHDLRRRVGVKVKSVGIDLESDAPRICLAFSVPLADVRGFRYEDFIRVEPSIALTAEPRDHELCLGGVSFATSYRVTIREGMPAAGGLKVNSPERLDVRIGERAPSVAFRGTAFILPRGGPEGVPVTTVNVDAVRLKLHRVSDRTLAPFAVRDRLMRAMTRWEIGADAESADADAGDGEGGARDRLAADDGELIWQGTMDVVRRDNASVVTGVPVRRLAGDLRPGLYVLTAEPAGRPQNELSHTMATQWLVISDLGLTVLRGSDGVDVFVRSLSTAKPVPGVPVALIARNNNELAKSVSDADGRVHFGGDAAGGSGGNRPLLVMAYGRDSDFSVLDLSRAAFDLADRGVGGRKPPGPLDAYLYGDRGVYRPGETVHLTALLRSDRVVAVEDFPVTLKVLRPNGTVFQAGVAPAAGGGAHLLQVRLSDTAPLGTWSVVAHADPGGVPIGRMTFQVEEFVPERLAVEATGAAYLVPDQPYALTVSSRFLYGPPAAGLTGAVEVSLAADPEPFPAFKGYAFGLVQETVTPRMTPFALPASDDQGISRLPVNVPAVPDTSKPLRAAFRVAVAEPGGRPSRATLSVPVRTHALAIGLRPRFADRRIEEGGEAAFDVITVDAEGKAIAAPRLDVELFREQVDYQWYLRDGTYNYRTTVRSSSLRRSALAIGAERPASLAFPSLPWGRYRVEVSDPASGAATSVRFVAGWQPVADAADTPDTVEVTVDKEAYRPGDTVRLRIEPPFAGEAVVVVATDRVLFARSIAVPAGGTTVDLPVSDAWGAGAYALVSLVRPPDAGRRPLPVRAIGVAWMPRDIAERSLAVELDGSGPVRPRQRLEVPVRVTDADGRPVVGVHVTLAAVDEGILRLTDFASPDPLRHFAGKRLLGVDVRDDYGRLIQAVSEPIGATRQGGDAGGVGLPEVPVTIVSLFSGPAQTDGQGIARFALDIPDFNGELRLMAVAFDRTRVGAAARARTVRDRLVADLVLPRFLAPGDESMATVSVHNVDAPPGAYRVTVAGSGAVAVPDASLTVDLGHNARRTLTFPLQGAATGSGQVTLSVSGPDGLALDRALAMTVRAPQPTETVFTATQVAAGGVAEVTAAPLASFLPGSASLRVAYSGRPPLDVAGLVAALDRYPYGCVEQVTSRAMPLLVIDDATAGLGHREADAKSPASGIAEGIRRVLDKQRYDGAFGVWSASGGDRPWLTAYALEFLVRAREKGYGVPEAPLLAGLGWLRRHAVDGDSGAEGLASRAYAVHVLALAKVLTPGVARYLHDAFLDKLPTPMARAQLAAALARLGDRERAAGAAAIATRTLKRDFWSADYGSTVRDAAALISVLGEVGLLGDRAQTLVDFLSVGKAIVDTTSTQEQAWLLMAAHTLASGQTPLALTRDGKTLPATDPYLLRPTEAELLRGIKVTNSGRRPVWQAVTVTGVPASPPPAAREGLAIKRYFYTRDGQPLNLDAVRQNDVFVIVLDGEAKTGINHEVLVSHLLPAGWEIENPALGGEAAAMPWLGELAKASAIAARDDRFVAAVDLSAERPSFRLAFVVRAVTPGTYALPGARIEDMYRPRFMARQAIGRVTVLPPS